MKLTGDVSAKDYEIDLFLKRIFSGVSSTFRNVFSTFKKQLEK